MRRMPRALARAALAVSVAAGPLSAEAATELESLRDDVRRTQEEFRKALELQQQMQRRMEELQKKLEALEEAERARAAQAAVPAAPSQPPAPQLAAQPRLSIAGKPLLFDFGATADIVGSLSGRSKDPDGNSTATFLGRQNRVFPRSVELAVGGAVDPYVRGDFIFSFAEEAELRDGRVARTLNGTVEEAYFTALTLPFGLQARGGRMRPHFGLLNTVHEHDLPQVDVPDVLRNFLGEDVLHENGAEVSWVAPLPFFLEFRAGAFSGDNDVSFGRGSIRNPLVIGRMKTFFELADDHAVQFGISGATGPNAESSPLSRTVLAGAAFKYKWKPVGQPHRQFILAGEYVFGHRRDELLMPASDGGVSVIRVQRHFDRQGFYVFGDYQLARQWVVGTRFDWSQFPTRRGDREYAIAPIRELPHHRVLPVTSRVQAHVPNLRSGRRRSIPPGHVLPGAPPGPSVLTGC